MRRLPSEYFSEKASERETYSKGIGSYFEIKTTELCARAPLPTSISTCECDITWK